VNPWAIVLTVAIGALIGYLLLWPVPIAPERWTPPQAPALTGDYQPNDLLAATQKLPAGPSPESVAVDADGHIFTGLLDGTLVRVAPGAEPVVVAETGDQLLGMAFDAAGNLIACNLNGRLLSVSANGDIRTLVHEVDGVPLKLVNDVDIGPDGTIYFSESSTETTDTVLDLLQHRGDGRLLAYDPVTGTTEVLLTGLYYANGVAVSADGSFVLIVETTAYRVRRVWLSGPRQGEDEIFIDNLPGFPDGISCDEDGVFWLALMNPRNPFIDWSMEHPWIRRVAARLPLAWFAGAAPRYGFVLGMNVNADVVANLQDPSGRHYAGISCVVRHDDRLYFGSLLEDSVGALPYPWRACTRAIR